VRDCDDLLAAVLRGAALDEVERRHLEVCARCGELAPALASLARALGESEPPTAPPGLGARVLLAAAPVLAAHAHAADAALLLQRAPRLDGHRLATALLPAVLLFPLLVLADVLLLRAVHDALAVLLPLPLTTYLVASYAALLAALVCLTFGAIPLLVQRQAALHSWKEGHV